MVSRVTFRAIVDINHGFQIVIRILEYWSLTCKLSGQRNDFSPHSHSTGIHISVIPQHLQNDWVPWGSASGLTFFRKAQVMVIDAVAKAWVSGLHISHTSTFMQVLEQIVTRPKLL